MVLEMINGRARSIGIARYPTTTSSRVCLILMGNDVLYRIGFIYVKTWYHTSLLRKLVSEKDEIKTTMRVQIKTLPTTLNNYVLRIPKWPRPLFGQINFGTDKRTWSHSATPELARRKHSFHRKIRFRTATGSSHLHDVEIQALIHTNDITQHKAGLYRWCGWEDLV